MGLHVVYISISWDLVNLDGSMYWIYNLPNASIVHVMTNVDKIVIMIYSVWYIAKWTNVQISQCFNYSELHWYDVWQLFSAWDNSNRNKESIKSSHKGFTFIPKRYHCYHAGEKHIVGLYQQIIILSETFLWCDDFMLGAIIFIWKRNNGRSH